MKISPIARSGAGDTAIPEEGRSASAERVARAKAVLSGGTAAVTPAAPDRTPASDRQVERTAQSIKRIKMRVNATPGAMEYAPTPTEVNPPATPEGNISDTVEPTPATPEVTKPLSPQFAALAKKERAIQVKEMAIAAREAAIAAKESGTTSDSSLIERIKADPLSVLDEQGITYDQLTEAILARSQDQGPAYQALKAEIKALKEGQENQTKSLSDRDQAAEVQVLAQMAKDADALLAAPDDPYEMVRVTNSKAKVIELIKREFHERGNILDVSEALEIVETQLFEDSLKIAQAKKIQTKLAAPAPTLPPAAPEQKPIRTLTNRDGTTVPMSRRERALRAARGELN